MKNKTVNKVIVAKNFISNNYNRPITIEDISREAHLSPTHLFRTFKQMNNCSPHQYLMQIRLDNAMIKLKNTRYSLNEIVGLVGFTCPSTFIKLFKSRFNLTPGKYKNQDDQKISQFEDFCVETISLVMDNHKV